MHLFSLKCSLVHLLLNSVVLGVVKSMNSETPPPAASCSEKWKHLGGSASRWSHFFFHGCVAGNLSDRCVCLWLALAPVAAEHGASSPAAQGVAPAGSLRKQQFPLRLADWFYTDVCSRALRRLRRFSQSSEGCTCTFAPTGALTCKISWWSSFYGSKVVFFLCFIHIFLSCCFRLIFRSQWNPRTWTKVADW